MYLLEKIQERKLEFFILFTVIVLSIFLRTYHFHDWLQFNPDQARDASIVSDVITGVAPLPLLGSIAGGTNFHLGPIFYYFGYVSASVFGNYPDVIAYPDLFFSLLSIPFLFFFLKKYFRSDIALALSGLMGVSYFFVNISRFSWNPNSIPFFTLLFLFSFLEMMEEKNKNKYLWPILVGISLGVGVQLHTFLLLILPTVSFVIFLYLWIQKNFLWRNMFLVILLSFFMNVPQIVSEIQTGGANVQQFFVSSDVQSEGRANIFSNGGTVLSCYIQANANMIFSLENMEGCGELFSPGKAVKKYGDTPGVLSNVYLFTVAMITSTLFLVIGYFFLGYYFRKESDYSRKNFLLLFLLYSTVSLLFFIPVASHMEPRYFVILFFVPFVLFGFFLQFLLEKISKNGIVLFWIIIMLCVILNLTIDWKAFALYRNNQASDSENSILGEIEPVAQYISENAYSEKIYITGGRIYLNRFFGPLRYLVNRQGTELVEFDDILDANKDASLFHIAPASLKKQRVGDILFGYIIQDQKQFGKIMISILK